MFTCKRGKDRKEERKKEGVAKGKDTLTATNGEYRSDEGRSDDGVRTEPCSDFHSYSR